MRKPILILAALLLVVSGVAAVSAYEAHIVNVTAHVENALDVPITPIGFGVTFPQEVRIATRTIELSGSAVTALPTNPDLPEPGDLTKVEYAIWAEWKVKDPAETPATYYKWMGEWLWVGFPSVVPPPPPADSIAELVRVGSKPSADPFAAPKAKAVPGLTGDLSTDAEVDTLAVVFLAPCFKGYYNADTDQKPTWWPALSEWPLIQGEDPLAGVDYGVDLKIQVVGINRNP